MKKIVYVFDDINYHSGAQKSTFYQMQCLSELYDVYALSLSRPSDSLKIPGKIIELENIWNESEIYIKRFKDIIMGNHSLKKKIRRIGYAVSVRIGIGMQFLNFFLYRGILEGLELFDVVIVVSEASKLRGLVCKLNKPKKIQWIHTDYKHWSQYSEWTKAITKNDSWIYKHYDYIVVLSNACKKGLISILPELNDKVVVIPNMVNYTEIQKKSLEDLNFKVSNKEYNFVTVGRLDREKNFDRILDVCKTLLYEGVDYAWYIIGDGPLKKYLVTKIEKMGLQKNVRLMGFVSNPLPIMKQCDFFVLLSDYEGTPVTIDEAVALEIPIIATCVGGIPDQLQRYGYNEALKFSDDLYSQFKEAMSQQAEIQWPDLKLNNKEILKNIIIIMEK